MSTENAAAVSEILKSGKEITALNDELGKYKTVFKKIMLDLQQASPIADEHQEFDTTATGDPLEIYNEFRKRSVNTGKIDLSSKQIQNIQHDATLAHSSITVLEDRLCALDYNLQNLAYSLNNSEQHSKGWNILIRGLKNLPVKNTTTPFDEFEFEFINFICNELNKHLGDHLNSHLQSQDIERAHLLYQRSKTATPVVIVRFVRRVVRNNVFFKRRFLKGTNISISDHLTRQNKEIFDEARAVFSAANTWTSLSKVFVNFGGQRYEMKSLTDVQNLNNIACRQEQSPTQQHLPAATSPDSSHVTSTVSTSELGSKDPAQASSYANVVSDKVHDKTPDAKSVPPSEKQGKNVDKSLKKTRRTSSYNKYPKSSGYGSTYKKPDLRYNP